MNEPEPYRIRLDGPPGAPLPKRAPSERRTPRAEPSGSRRGSEAPREREGDYYEGYLRRRWRAFDVVVALLLGIAAAIAVLATLGDYGHTWDEALYYKPARESGRWVIDALSGKDAIKTPEVINAHWGTRADGHDPLHPEIAPVARTMSGLGYHLLPQSWDEQTRLRVPVAVAYGLTVMLLFLLGAREYGHAGGWAAALIYVGMPRVFGHAHLAASETWSNLAVVLCAMAFLSGIRRVSGSVAFAAAFAFAFLTKVTLMLLPLPLMLWGQMYARRTYATNMFAMVALAPALILLCWPWVWPAVGPRVLEYLNFYVQHQSTAVFYFGQKWGYIHGPAAPWHYPFVTAGISLPEWTLVFLGVGVVRALAQVSVRPVPVLFLLLALFPMVQSALPGAPKYDGERLFMSAYPFLALVAAGGVAAFMAPFLTPWRRKATQAGKITAGLMLAAIGGASAWDLYSNHPHQLNYFNRTVGGAAGAYAKGFETSYWHESLNHDVVMWLNREAPTSGTLTVLSINGLAVEQLQEWGRLRDDLRLVPRGESADLVLLQVRQGFMATPERVLHMGHRPLFQYPEEGVPRLQIFDGKALEGAASAADGETTRAALVEPPPEMGETARPKTEPRDDATTESAPVTAPDDDGTTGP